MKNDIKVLNVTPHGKGKAMSLEVEYTLNGVFDRINFSFSERGEAVINTDNALLPRLDKEISGPILLELVAETKIWWNKNR